MNEENFLRFVNVLDGAIEYVLQNESTWKHRKEFGRDEHELKALLLKSESYWLGLREAQGVDIEDAFKCQWCDYAEICVWRQVKANEFSEKNKRHSVQFNVVV